MLARRIIPTLLILDGKLVKGQRFDNKRVVGNPVQAAEVHSARGVDEMLVLDLSEDAPHVELIEQVVSRCWCPVTVGGGIRTAEQARALLNVGADKLCVGPRGGMLVVRELSRRYGSQAVSYSVNVECGFLAARYALEAQESGAGEIVVQCPSRDGTMGGYDLKAISCAAHAVEIPVIASSGCRDYEDMFDALRCGASAVAAGALFTFTDATPRAAAEYLHSKGMEVRLA